MESTNGEVWGNSESSRFSVTMLRKINECESRYCLHSHKIEIMMMLNEPVLLTYVENKSWPTLHFYSALFTLALLGSQPHNHR